MSAPERTTSLWVVAVLSSVVLLLARLAVATGTGFGDAEALYASYALYPQPAYLDHPGLIGSLARLLGGGAPPSPLTAHVATSVLALAVPWVGALASRAAGASTAGALRVLLCLCWLPELSVGLFGLTPDLPLSLLWLSALGCAAFALDSEAASYRALIATLGVGVAVGLATLAKASGAVLGLALFVASFSVARARYRTLAPYGAIAVALVLLSPVIAWELREGLPMLRHRLISTQGSAGFSLRNLAAFVGGQLAYVTPPFLLGAALVLRDLFRRRRQDAISRMLFQSTLVVAVPLAFLSLWSRVAEPHWFAPAYLGLALHLGRTEAVGPRLGRACVITGAAVVALALVWIRTPLPPRLLGSAYRPRYDIANDLHAWKPGGKLLDRVLAARALEGESDPVVVGPHWIVCAQLQAHLGRRARVGCNGPGRDDFDGWLPQATWSSARHVLFVHDSRFRLDPARELPDRTVRAVDETQVLRGGRVVRTIWVTDLERTFDSADDP